MRSRRRSQKAPVRGLGAPARWATTKGRYSRNPEMRKKTETPISIRAV